MSQIEIKWEYIFAIAVIIVVGVGIALDKLTAENFIAILGLIFTFLTGRYAVNILTKELSELRTWKLEQPG